MTEEQVTKAIIKKLQSSGWTIVAFDFPQSGTGKMLHPNGGNSEKNKGGIIPDIVAVKGAACLFFENKDRVVVSDFKKLADVKNGGDYSNAIADLLSGYNVEKIYYGIGIPKVKYCDRARANTPLVDFIVAVSEDGSVEFLYNASEILM